MPGRVRRPPRRAVAGGDFDGHTPGHRTVVGEVTSVNPASRPDGSWVAGELRPLDALAGVRLAFVGEDLPPYLVGTTVHLSGYYDVHPAHGWQLRVTTARVERPTDGRAVERYIDAHVDRCGPKIARRIVAAFGPHCLSLLEADPDIMRREFGPGLGATLAQAWRLWAAQARRDSVAHRLAARLVEVGVSYGDARRVTTYFSTAEAAEVASLRHPYRLLEVPGFGWQKADRIARILGVPSDAPERYEAACQTALDAARDHGHGGLPLQVLVDRACRLVTEAPRTQVAAAVARLSEAGEVVRVGAVVQHPEVHRQEWTLAERLADLARCERPLFADDQARVQRILAASGLTKRQRDAVEMCLVSGVSVLTGGPGTGKTTTLRTYLACCRAIGRRVQIVAPTGKAASRAADVTGDRSASTVHRLLGSSQRSGGTVQPLPVDSIVLDEASMCDLDTATWLVSALDPVRTSLLWTGDVDQLPSVGAGQVLADVIASGCVPVARLTAPHRAHRDGRIVRNARRLLEGKPLDLTVSAAGDWDFIELPPDKDPSVLLEYALDAVRSAVAAGAVPGRDMQVMAPIWGGPAGVDALNTALQALLNPGGLPGPLVGGGSRARVGDRIIQTRNLYELAVPLYNGDTGTVTAADARAGTMTVRLDDGREAQLGGVQCLMLRLAWAVTVHRAQGSEYSHAILCYDHRAHPAMLDPRVLYTGVTRAKQRLTLIGTREAVRRAEQAPRAVRHTALRRQIVTAFGGDPDMAGRQQTRETELFAEKVREYLARAETDTTLALSFEAIAADTHVSRGHFSRTDDPIYGVVANEVRDLRASRARDTTAPIREANPGPSSMPDAELAARVQHYATEAGRTMQMWLARHRRQGATSDAPLLLHDLDVTSGTLHKHADALRPLIAEQQVRSARDIGRSGEAP